MAEKPSVGRIVLVRSESFQGVNNRSETAPAIITRVHSDTLINARAFFDGITDDWLTSIPLEGTQESATVTWSWPQRV